MYVINVRTFHYGIYDIREKNLFIVLSNEKLYDVKRLLYSNNNKKNLNIAMRPNSSILLFKNLITDNII